MYRASVKNRGKWISRFVDGAKAKLGGKLGGVEWGMASAGGVVYAPLSDFGLPTAGGLFALDAASVTPTCCTGPPTPAPAGLGPASSRRSRSGARRPGRRL